MSGLVETGKCRECDADTWSAYDWKPFNSEIHECTNMDCGLRIDTLNMERRYMDKEEILALRIWMGYEGDVLET